MFEILCQKNRAGHGEVFYHGALSYFDGRAFQIFGDDIKTYGRSLMKPFQIQMFKDELNDLTQEQIAISVASHNGTAEHIGMAKTVLADLSEEHLEISCSAPLEPGEEKSQWANPCSGKHSAIIRGLAQKGIDPKGYTEKDHPYNDLYKSIVEKHCNTKLQTRAVDGCRLPTYVQTLSSLSKGFYNVATKDEFNWISQAMKAHPYLVGGKTRIDTELMSIKGADILAKEGADGILAFVIVHENKVHGFCLKMAQGRSPVAMKFIASQILVNFDIVYNYKETDELNISVDFQKFINETLP